VQKSIYIENIIDKEEDRKKEDRKEDGQSLSNWKHRSTPN